MKSNAILFGLFFVAFLSFNAGAWSSYEDDIDDADWQEDCDEVFVFNNGMGAVTFRHTVHQNDPAHGSVGKCDNCHASGLFPQKYDDSVSIATAAHKVCKGCHKASGSAGAPVNCSDCHKKK